MKQIIFQDTDIQFENQNICINIMSHINYKFIN